MGLGSRYRSLHCSPVNQAPASETAENTDKVSWQVNPEMCSRSSVGGSSDPATASAQDYTDRFSRARYTDEVCR